MDIIFSARNYFIPCLIFLIILIIAFIKLKDLKMLIGIIMMLIALFIYSPWTQDISDKTRIILTVIMIVLGAIIYADKYKK
jgi:ABC-type proline/glycine betaine transport system permease subunit